MSGIEVAGLVFGVLPLLIEAVKSYSTVSKKVHTLRHYSKEVKSISEQLKVHKGIFLNEVRLLLRLIEDEEEVESMLEDAGDRRWTSKQLNDKLSAVLRDSFDICRSIIEEAKDVIETMSGEMDKFNVLLDQKSKGESIKSTLKRLGGAIKITFDKSRHEQCLTSLRDRNGELSALRSQISAFKRHEITTTSNGIQHQRLPTKLQSVHSASQKLHEALCGAWCCDDLAHGGHYAKLCVEAEVQAEVRLDLAISCHEPSSALNGCSSQKPPIWLYVQSMSTAGDSHGQQTTQAVPKIPRPPLPLELMTPCAVNVLKKKASSDLQQRSKKAKRVHFVDASTASVPGPATSTSLIKAAALGVDLCQTKNICSYLQQYYQAPRVTSTKCCIGYLESPRTYKHLFYLREDDQSTRSPPGAPVASVYSIFDIMRQDADDALTVEDQYRLAHKTALATLQFNDTPWLCERWRLQDLSYFGTNNTLDTEALKTLHLSSQISAPAASSATTHTMDGIQHPDDLVSDQVRYGINNTTLFFLGVALLEIAHWAPLETKMTPRDLNNEVFAARRLAAARAPLGPQYQKIAEKCLQCNFGFGTNLSNARLQTAVYNDVVCELESMIERLAI